MWTVLTGTEFSPVSKRKLVDRVTGGDAPCLLFFSLPRNFKQSNITHSVQRLSVSFEGTMRRLCFYAGVFPVGFCVLLLEIIQTRILSVVVWYDLPFWLSAWGCLV
jgi:hypothetical protein